MRQRSIARAVAASFLALAILPILVAALAASVLISKGLDEGISQELAAITNAAAIEAERALKPAVRVLDALSFYMASAPGPADIVRFLDANQRSRSEIEAFLLLDAEGRVLELSPRNERLRREDLSGQPAFAEAWRRSGAVFSRPYISGIDGQATVAVYRSLGSRMGLIFLDLDDLSSFLDRLRLSSSDHVAIVDESGRYIAHSQREMVDEQRYARALPPSGRLEVSEEEDGAHLLQSQIIRGTDWKVLYYRDAREARALLPHILGGLALIAFLSLVFALVLFLGIVRTLSPPFGRIVAEARALAEGHYERRVSGDWPAELQTIAMAFNQMAESVERRDRELQRSEERYRALFFGSEVPALLFEPTTGRIRDANRAAFRYYGYGREELLQLRTWDLNTLPEETVREKMLAARDRNLSSYRFTHRLKGGALREVEVFSTPVEVESEIYIYALVFDITVRVAAERQVQADLEEKTVLLKEVHHRVKNNLQIVASLLHLQSRFIRDPADALLFQSSQDRIHSMALTHEILYQSPDLSSVDMAAYTERLVSYLRDAYPLPGLDIEARIGQFSLALERALPCGLIINELVTNACVHALARAAEPKVALRLELEPAEEGNPRFILLEVEDRGPGLPPGFDPETSSSLGLSLVQNLGRQLNGRIEWLAAKPGQPHPGLLVRLRFPHR